MTMLIGEIASAKDGWSDHPESPMIKKNESMPMIKKNESIRAGLSQGKGIGGSRVGIGGMTRVSSRVQSRSGSGRIGRVGPGRALSFFFIPFGTLHLIKAAVFGRCFPRND